MKTPTQDATMPQRAYSYTRFSTGGQADGDSERRQTEWPAVVAAEQGWVLDDTLSFIDRGRSGFHRKNLTATSGLTQFLNHVERGRITRGSILIIENIDRLSRADVDTAHDLFRSIIRAGVWICTRTPFRIYKGDKDASFMDLLEPIWIMYCAHMESVKKSHRVAEAWKTARRLCQSGEGVHQARPPWWLKRVGEGYEADAAQMPALRRALELVRQGHGTGRVVQKLTAEGFRPPSRTGRWTETALRNTLQSRSLLGEYQPHQMAEGKRVPTGRPIADYYPAVIDADEWAHVQASVGGRRHKCGRPASSVGENLFTGILYDARTLRPMVQRPTRRKLRYLQVHGEAASESSIKYERLEECILDTLATLRPEDVLEPSVRADEREKEAARLTARVTALDHRQRQLQEAAADPDQDAAAILPVLSKVSSDLKAAAQQLERMKLEARSGRAEALAEAQTLREIRDQTQGEARRELDRRIKAALPAVVSSIWVQCQMVGKRKKIVHVKLYLQSGTPRYVQLLPENLPDAVEPWDLSAADFRAGDVGNVTAEREAMAEVR